MQKPSQREIAEATKQLNQEIEEDLRAEPDGNKPAIKPKRPSIRARKLPPGRWLCEHNRESPRYRSHGSRAEHRRVGQASRRPPHREAVGDRGQGDPTREGVCALGRCARVRPFHQERTDPDWKPEVSGTRSRPRSGEALRRCLRWSLKVTLTRRSTGGASTRRTAPSPCPCGAITAHFFVRLLPTSVSAGLRPSRSRLRRSSPICLAARPCGDGYKSLNPKPRSYGNSCRTSPPRTTPVR
jgi:hypothetical protein